MTATTEAETVSRTADGAAASLYLQNGDLAFANVRWIDDAVHLISIPHRRTVEWAAVRVSLDGQTCTLARIHERGAMQCVIVATFDVTPAEHEHATMTRRVGRLHVVFPDGSTFDRDVVQDRRSPSRRYELVAMTLCKDDHALLPLWVAHHRRLGVQHFFVYYNGVWPRDALAAYRTAMPGIVTFVDWPLPYRARIGLGDRHCAQTTAMNDFLHWSRSFATWALFCDLDEYVYLRTKCVDLSRDDTHAYLFKNRWAVFRERAMVDVDDVRLDGPWLLDGREYPTHKGQAHRGKMVVRVASFDTVSVHHPHDSWRWQYAEHASWRRCVTLNTASAFHCHLQNSVKNNLGRFSEAAETVSPSSGLTLR